METVNVDAIIRKLRIEKSGTLHGRNENPGSYAKDCGEFEEKIIAKVGEIRNQGIKELKDQSDECRRRIAAAKNFDNHVRDLGNDAVVKIEGAFLKQQKKAEDARKVFEYASDELQDFQEKNDLHSRTADTHGDLLRFCAILGLVLLLESIVNGIFFSSVHEIGQIGGLGLALGISVINLGVAIICGALYRNVNHVSPTKKRRGNVAFWFGIVFALGWNFFVGHIRDAATALVGESVLEKAAQKVGENIAAGNLWLNSTDAWILFVLGILMAAFAGWKAYGCVDRYPGYSGVSRKLAKKRDNFYRACDDGIIELTKLKDEAVEGARHKRHDAEEKFKTGVHAHKKLGELQSEYLPLSQGYDDLVNRLLGTYRDANRRYRKTPEPVYFAEPYTFGERTPIGDANAIPNPPDAQDTERFCALVEAEIDRITETYKEYRNRLERERRGPSADFVPNNRPSMAKLEYEGAL